MIYMPKRMRISRKPKGKIRYAVVGIGHIAQVAVLPAFEHASHNSELAALVSGDELKHEKLGEKYGVHTYTYDEYDQCLKSGKIDAVYIALPNSLHREFTVRALKAGIHVLCEKPMAVTEEECEEMIRASEENSARLMIAYRLHFEEANLRAINLCRSGELGDVRLFNSVFTMQVRPGDIRLKNETGGGTLYDIGVYCINAARYLFQAEPEAVLATSANKGDERFREVDEMTSVILRFPGDRLAAFTCSFGAADVSEYEVVGTKGRLRLDPAYEYAAELRHELTVGGKTTRKKYGKRDQFAAELLYFSDCVLNGKYPEPSGTEGLADVRIIRALYQSSETGQWIRLGDFTRMKRPNLSQEIKRPPVDHPPATVHAESPSLPS